MSKKFVCSDNVFLLLFRALFWGDSNLVVTCNMFKDFPLGTLHIFQILKKIYWFISFFVMLVSMSNSYIFSWFIIYFIKLTFQQFIATFLRCQSSNVLRFLAYFTILTAWLFLLSSRNSFSMPSVLSSFRDSFLS